MQDKQSVPSECGTALESINVIRMLISKYTIHKHTHACIYTHTGILNCIAEIIKPGMSLYELLVENCIVTVNICSSVGAVDTVAVDTSSYTIN